jgi:hypothetical protein
MQSAHVVDTEINTTFQLRLSHAYVYGQTARDPNRVMRRCDITAQLYINQCP